MTGLHLLSSVLVGTSLPGFDGPLLFPFATRWPHMRTCPPLFSPSVPLPTPLCFLARTLREVPSLNLSFNVFWLYNFCPASRVTQPSWMLFLHGRLDTAFLLSSPPRPSLFEPQSFGSMRQQCSHRPSRILPSTFLITRSPVLCLWRPSPFFFRFFFPDRDLLAFPAPTRC